MILYLVEMGRLNVVERRLERFRQEPVSVRNAAGVIVLATAIVVIGAGVLIAHDELSDREFIERRFEELERKLEALAPTTSHSPPQPPPPAG